MFSDEDDTDPKVLSSFEKLSQTTNILNALLSSSVAIEPSPEENKAELGQLQALSDILAEYQEQPYLLDPHLEKLVVPIVNVLRSHAKDFVGPTTIYSATRVKRLSLVLYSFVRLRGYKAVVRFFPHEVSDISVAVAYMSSDGPVKEADNWALRYLILLWLSLVCMLPFDLAQFDNDGNGETALVLEEIARRELDKAGIERDGAALVLSKLYMRRDSGRLFSSFLDKLEREIQGSPRLFACIGALQVIAEVTKSAPSELLHAHLVRMQAIVSGLANVEALAENTVIRKLRTKSISRIAVRMLPTKSRRRRTEEDEEEYDPPSEVEDAFEKLFELLQDKIIQDTSVRWSSAKGLSRISERLPMSFVDQVLDNILGYFSIHSSNINVSELPAAAEYPWHGASLACAEFARRDLISRTRLPEVINWMLKALFFDVRKGSFSVGSNVRDAAAYVLWSLSRTQTKDRIEPHATTLAQKLATVALFDREIHIRRAASAAFQENVGRMGLFPHGIAVLGKTDFYSVSIRRNAFLIAAPQVAMYDKYIQPILYHLFEVTVRHWDESIRRLGAQSLRKICELDLLRLGPEMIDKASTLLVSADTTYVHGGLLVLSELASAFRDSSVGKETEEYYQKIFNSLNSVPSTILFSPRNHLITEAACYVVASSISTRDVEALKASTKSPHWKVTIMEGLRHRHTGVQVAAAVAMTSLNSKRSSPIIQQSLAYVLGALDYRCHTNGLDTALSCLLDVVNPLSPDFFTNVEARRNAYTSLARIVTHLSAGLNEFIPSDKMKAIFDAFFIGIDDYTINERGDVGSWVRLACVKGFCSMFEALIGQASNVRPFSSKASPEGATYFALCLPVDTYHRAVGSILKQGVERLDNVRQCVGELFMTLLELLPPAIEHGEEWTVRDKPMFINLLKSPDSPGWNDGFWLYPRAIHFLDVQAYRMPILRGLVLSIGSKTSSTCQPASSAICAYARTLTLDNKTNDMTQTHTYSLHTLIEELLSIMRDNPTSNNTIVPVLQTFNILLQGDTLLSSALVDAPQCLEVFEVLLDMATKNVNRLKNMQRVEESMKVVANMLSLPTPGLRLKAIAALRLFLQHKYPKIRSDTAETLYVVLQTNDIDYDEAADEILLETEW
ncbi:hypothetical protein M0805_000146 [Coniferiporia weirii]|nr:hypothetical protein M0805_000146 [Coniferiporia weirii]